MTDVTTPAIPSPPLPPRSSPYSLVYAALIALPVVLAVALWGHYLGYALEIESAFLDRSITCLLLVLGLLASLLAVRGDTYNATAEGPFYRRITAPGRVAILVITMTFFVGAIKEGRGEHSHEMEIAQQKAVFDRQFLAQEATLLIQVDSLQMALNTATGKAVALINSSMTNLSATERTELGNQFKGILAGVEVEAAGIRQNFDARTRESAEILQGTNTLLASLVDPNTGVVAQLGQSESRLARSLTEGLATTRTQVDQDVEARLAALEDRVSGRFGNLESAFRLRDSADDARAADLRGAVASLAKTDTTLARSLEEVLRLVSQRPALAQQPADSVRPAGN